MLKINKYIFFIIVFIGLWMTSYKGYAQEKYMILLDLKPDNYFSLIQKGSYELYTDKEGSRLLNKYTKECCVFLRVYKRIGSLMYVRLRYSGLKITDSCSKIKEYHLIQNCLDTLNGEEIDVVLHTTGEIMSIQGLGELKTKAVKIAINEGIQDTTNFIKYFEMFFSNASMREEFESFLKIYFPKKVKLEDSWNTKLLTDKEYKANIRNVVKLMGVTETAYFLDVFSKISSKRSFFQKIFKATEILGEQHTVYQLDLKHKFPKKLDSIIKYKINPSEEDKYYVRVVINWERL